MKWHPDVALVVSLTITEVSGMVCCWYGVELTSVVMVVHVSGYIVIDKLCRVCDYPRGFFVDTCGTSNTIRTMVMHINLHFESPFLLFWFGSGI
jgi:hypothetical protein